MGLLLGSTRTCCTGRLLLIWCGMAVVMCWVILERPLALQCLLQDDIWQLDPAYVILLESKPERVQHVQTMMAEHPCMKISIWPGITTDRLGEDRWKVLPVAHTHNDHHNHNSTLCTSLSTLPSTLPISCGSWCQCRS